MKNPNHFFSVTVKVFEWSARYYWWIIVPTGIWFIHFRLISSLNTSINAPVSEIFFIATQIIGAFLVLHSINSNLKHFNSSLSKLFINPIRHFPCFIKRSQSRTVFVEPVGIEIGTSHVSFSTGDEPKTIEDKLHSLTKRVDEIEGRLGKEFREIMQRVDREGKANRERYSSIKRQAKDLEDKFKDIHTGGLEQQVFGVLIAMHQPVVEVLYNLFS